MQPRASCFRFNDNRILYLNTYNSYKCENTNSLTLVNKLDNIRYTQVNKWKLISFYRGLKERKEKKVIDDVKYLR
jgi:hypothetical protein